MEAPEILLVLRQRGGAVRLVGDEGIEVSPRRVLDDSLRDEIRSHKAQVVAELRRTGASELTDGTVLEDRHSLGAVRLNSRFGELWIALSEDTAAQIRAEEARRPEPRPVLESSDIAALRGKSEIMIQAVLKVAAAFPGARVIQ